MKEYASTKMSEELSQLCLRLFSIEAVKFGSFLLKNGFYSPVYIDLRVITSYPDVLEDVAKHMYGIASKLSYDNICGVPYTALPIATVISVQNKIPMLVRRREAKDYGTKKMVEGHFKQDDVCLIVEDVVTSGTSIMETAQLLQSVGLKVKDAIVMLDRDQGGVPNLAKEGVAMHSVLTIHDIVKVLHQNGKITEEMVNNVEEFLVKHSNAPLKPQILPETETKPFKVYSHKQRLDLLQHPICKKLFAIMDSKQTNLCVAVDVTTSGALLNMAELIGPHICVLKTHIDMITDFTEGVITKLKEIAARHDFLLFEDAKFSDIGNTVYWQYKNAVHRIVEWADIVTAHALPGPGIVKGLRKAAQGKDDRACLLIAQLSSEGNLISNEYIKATVAMAEENESFVAGFICQSRVSSNPNFVRMIPGVQLNPPGSDGLGQLYLSPEEVVTKRGADVIIVGRGITQASDPAQAALQYKEAGYKAYLSTLL